MADLMRDAVEPMLAAVDAAAGDGYSALLYGSLARGDYHPKTSDINLLLVLRQVSPAFLKALGPAFRAWRKHSYSPPLVIARDEWARATDVFPLEITDMRAACRVLRGPDPLDGLVVERGALRHALEGELRGKLLRLRQGFTLLHEDPKSLGGLASHTLPTLLVLFRALLQLAGRTVAPADAEGIVRDVADVAGGTADGALAVVARRAEADWACPPEVFEGYLDLAARAARHVDHFHTGES